MQRSVEARPHFNPVQTPFRFPHDVALRPNKTSPRAFLLALREGGLYNLTSGYKVGNLAATVVK